MTDTPELTGASAPDQFMITRLVAPGLSLDLTQQLDEYRRIFERSWGHTDLTRRYTSMLTPSERAWLLKNEPERYWEGLPKFFQAFLRSQLRDASETGDLDDMPDGLIELYTSGKMQIKGERSR